jgi:hypothetical protein
MIETNWLRIAFSRNCERQEMVRDIAASADRSAPPPTKEKRYDNLQRENMQLVTDCAVLCSPDRRKFRIYFEYVI